MRTAEACDAFMTVQDTHEYTFRRACRGIREMRRFRVSIKLAHISFEAVVRGVSIKRLLQAGVVGRPGETKIRWAHV